MRRVATPFPRPLDADFLTILAVALAVAFGGLALSGAPIDPPTLLGALLVAPLGAFALARGIRRGATEPQAAR